MKTSIDAKWEVASENPEKSSLPFKGRVRVGMGENWR
jgi:hypothetical protein